MKSKRKDTEKKGRAGARDKGYSADDFVLLDAEEGGEGSLDLALVVDEVSVHAKTATVIRLKRLDKDFFALPKDETKVSVSDIRGKVAVQKTGEDDCFKLAEGESQRIQEQEDELEGECNMKKIRYRNHYIKTPVGGRRPARPSPSEL